MLLAKDNSHLTNDQQFVMNWSLVSLKGAVVVVIVW